MAEIGRITKITRFKTQKKEEAKKGLEKCANIAKVAIVKLETFVNKYHETRNNDKINEI